MLEVTVMRKATDRLSIRRRLKCIHVDEPADIEAAERLFARLCVRMMLAEQRTGQRNKEEPETTREDV